MDAQEIRTLLGKSIFERAQKYRKRILQSSCTTNEDGVRHLTALVQGSGPDCYYTQVWLRENGSFVSASCDCPYNQNGDGTYCKHIGALLLQDAEKNPPAPEKKPESIPGVQRGVAGLSTEPRKDSYSAGLDMLFGRKWRGEEPETDYEAQLLLKRYQREDAQPQPQNAAQRTGFALLEPELTPHNGRIWLRLRVSDGIGGRQYLVKSIPQFLDAIERGESVSYGKSLAFVHRWDAFAPDAQQLLRLLRRQVSARQAFEAEGTMRSGWEKGPAGGLPLTGEGLDALVELYAAEGVVGGYTLKEGLPVISLKVERRKGGVQLSCTPALRGVQGLDYAYLLGESTLWRMQREECRRVLPVLDTFGAQLVLYQRGCRRLLQLCAAGIGQPGQHRGPRPAAAEPDPAGTGGAVLSGRRSGAYRHGVPGLSVRRGQGSPRRAGAPGSFAGCPHREPGKAPAGDLSGTRERQAGALQPFRGGGAFPAAGGGHSRPAGHGRGVPDRCLPQLTSRPA